MIDFKTRTTEIIPLARLHNNTGQIPGLPANPRTINREKYERLKQSLTDNPEFLESNPLKVIEHEGEFVIIGGNMRKRALADLGYKAVPCAVLDPATPAEKLRAYTVLDNSQFGQWDIDALANEWDIDRLQSWGVDLPDLQLEPEPEPEAQEDNFTDEEMDEAPLRTQRGDIWLLGDHRLMVGDSTKQDDITRLMNGHKADLLLTDPPYNVNYSEKLKRLGKSGIKGNAVRRLDLIENDRMSDAAFRDFLVSAFRNASDAMRPGAAFYIWHASMQSDCFIEAVRAVGLEWKQLLIWYKNSFVIGRQDYQWIHEPCLYGWKGGAKHYFRDDRSQTTVYDNTVDYRKMGKPELIKVIRELTRPTTEPTTVWREDKPQHSDLHPTMKPVRLFGRSVGNSAREGDIVLDIFAGSGTAIIACEQLGRRCYSMENEPRYADAILARWEKLTGRRAVKQPETKQQATQP